MAQQFDPSHDQRRPFPGIERDCSQKPRRRRRARIRHRHPLGGRPRGQRLRRPDRPEPEDDDRRHAQACRRGPGEIQGVSSTLRSVVTGVGDYLPARIVTNDDLAKIVDTSDEWIRERTGIRQRREAVEGETTSDLATGAAARALATAGRTPADVDLIVVGTTTPDLTFPAAATMVQRKLGCPIGIAFDVQAVCSGFVYALAVADNFVARGQSQVRPGHRRRDHDPADGLDRPRHLRAVRRRRRRRGAGAARRAGDHGRPRRAGRRPARRRRPSRTCSTSTAAPRPPARSASCACRATRCSATPWSTSPRRCSPRPRRPASRSPRSTGSSRTRPTSASCEGVAHRLGIDESRVISTVAEHANTSAASIPLAWAQGIADGRIKPGQLLLIEAMGGGLTWGAAVIRL